MGATALLTELSSLVDALIKADYRVIGPTVRDNAIVLSELDSAARLPYGWGVESAPGRYRLHQRDDAAAFDNSAGPQSWKQVLHPPRRQLLDADRTDDGFTVSTTDDDVPRLALLGVRPCDLRAIGVQQRVLGGRYAQIREAAFVIAVNCTRPAATCFCVSAGGGPQAEPGAADIVLTELVTDGEARYLAEAGSDAGERLLADLPRRTAGREEVSLAQRAVDAAARQMPRELPAANLPSVLAAAVESPHWDDVASRCLSCGNCTMVCPTCFCTSVTDATDLTGDHAERWEHWSSCFDLDFSYLHGGPIRTSTASRYRQWLTHKFGTWPAQFGESGCVGCGRCIAWCPVGIDVTTELAALAQTGVTDEPAPLAQIDVLALAGAR